MSGKYYLMLIVAVAVISCNKDGASKTDKYIVSASKMIGLTGDNWNNAEPKLMDKVGYQYAGSPVNVSNLVKAEVRLPAIDDSTKIENGAIYLNVAPDNVIHYAAYDTEPIAQTIAYAMMLNYNNESLKALTGITSSRGSFVDNNIGGSATVDGILSKLKNGQAADQLAISYQISGRGTIFTIVVFKQNDGRYQFSYRGNW